MMKPVKIMLNDVIMQGVVEEEEYVGIDQAVCIRMPFDDMVMVTRASGRIEMYDAMHLTREWMRAPENIFIEKYRFKWHPTLSLIRKAKKDE